MPVAGDSFYLDPLPLPSCQVNVVLAEAVSALGVAVCLAGLDTEAYNNDRDRNYASNVRWQIGHRD